MFPCGNVGELVQGLHGMYRGVSSIPTSPKLGARVGDACLSSQDDQKFKFIAVLNYIVEFESSLEYIQFHTQNVSEIIRRIFGGNYKNLNMILKYTVWGNQNTKVLKGNLMTFESYLSYSFVFNFPFMQYHVSHIEDS